MGNKKLKIHQNQNHLKNKIRKKARNKNQSQLFGILTPMHSQANLVIKIGIVIMIDIKNQLNATDVAKQAMLQDYVSNLLLRLQSVCIAVGITTTENVSIKYVETAVRMGI